MTETQFVGEGVEKYESGIKDAAGRDCGSTVIYGVLFEGEKQYLTAYVHANRDGADFCRNSGALRKIELTSTNDAAASAARASWVAEKVAQAKDRAAQKWARRA